MDTFRSIISRRKILTTCLPGLAIFGSVATALGAPKMIKPWQYIAKKDSINNTDGTPLQFIPKNPKDRQPTKNEFKKYARCPYCGMVRKMWSHTRHLIHYENDVVDATCSLHCTALSLSLNLDLNPQAIYVGDAGSTSEVKPLVLVDDAVYLVGAKQPGTMSSRSKWAYASASAAEAVAQKIGGKKVGFDEALTAAYLDMANDTVMIRKKRAKKRKLEIG